jgi:hypothetical protein
MFGGRYPNIDRWAMRHHSGKAVPFRALPPIGRPVFRGRSSGGIIMNTALARRLALGDRVIWMGKDDCQPSGPGTIIRITAHQVEVLWEGETARRYRRAQLYNLRHVKLISAAAEPRCKPPNRLESASFVGVCVVRPAAKQDQVSIEVGRWAVGGDGAR